MQRLYPPLVLSEYFDHSDRLLDGGSKIWLVRNCTILLIPLLQVVYPVVLIVTVQARGGSLIMDSEPTPHLTHLLSFPRHVVSRTVHPVNAIHHDQQQNFL